MLTFLLSNLATQNLAQKHKQNCVSGIFNYVSIWYLGMFSTCCLNRETCVVWRCSTVKLYVACKCKIEVNVLVTAGPGAFWNNVTTLKVEQNNADVHDLVLFNFKICIKKQSIENIDIFI